MAHARHRAGHRRGAGPAARTVDSAALAPGGYTLRLRATDSAATAGEDRAFFFSLAPDGLLKRGYPRAARHLRRVLAAARGPRTATGARDRARHRRRPACACSPGAPGGCSADGRRPCAAHGTRVRGAGGSGTLRRASSAPPRSATSRAATAGRRSSPPASTAASTPGPPRGRRLRGFPVRIDLRRRRRATAAATAPIYASPGPRRPGRRPQARHRGRRGRPEGLRLRRPRPPAARLARARRDPTATTGQDPLLAGDRRPQRRRLARRRGGHRRGLRLARRRPPGASTRSRRAGERPAGLAGQARGAVGRRDPARRRGRADVAARWPTSTATVATRSRWRRSPASPSSTAATAPACRATGGGQPLPVPRPRRAPRRRARRPRSRSAATRAFGRTSPGGPLRLFGGMVDSRLARRSCRPPRAIPFEHLLGGWDAAAGDGCAPSRARWRAGRSSPAPARGRRGRRRRTRRRSRGRAATACTRSVRTAASRRAGRSRPAAGCSPPPAVGDVDGDGLSRWSR